MDNTKKAYAYCLRLLAIRDYSVHELGTKINSKIDLQEQELEQLIDGMKAKGYLNDERFTRNYIGWQLSRKPQGIYALRQKLIQKGISSDVADKELSLQNIDEVSMATELIKKKANSMKSLDREKVKQKLFRFLQSRGFKQQTIFQALNWKE
jgi:regulatory protein